MQMNSLLNSKNLNCIFPGITFVEPHKNARPKFHFQRHMGSSRASQCTCNSSYSCPNVYQCLRYASTADCNTTQTLTVPNRSTLVLETQSMRAQHCLQHCQQAHSQVQPAEERCQSQTQLNKIGLGMSTVLMATLCLKSLFSTLLGSWNLE